MKLKRLGLVALAFSLVLSACGKKDGSGSGGASEFTIAVGGEPKFLDTSTTQDSVTHYVTAQMYDTLLSYDQQGNLVNNLAESYEVSEDGLTYTIHLVDTVWSDGVKLTAKDFVFAAKRSLNYGTAEAYYLYYITQNVKNAAALEGKGIDEMDSLGIKAVDDLTLEITLERPVPYFDQMLTGEIFAPQREDVAVLGSSTWANDPSVPVTGAYKLESVKDKEEIVLVKNENYRFADKVTVEKLRFLVMPDQQAQLNAFKTGEVDLALNVPSDVVHTYAGKPELLILKPYVINYFVIINSFKSDTKALEDPNIRRALALAINREDVLKALNGGELQYPLYGLVPKGIPGVDGDFREEQDAKKPYLETNVEEAKKLLEAAGYSSSKPLKLTYSYNSNQMHDTVAQAIQAMWKEVGVDVTLEPSELRVFFDNRDNGKYELARHAMSADYLDPMIYLEMFDSRNQKVSVVDDQKYDKMLDDANKEKDPKKRMEMLHEAETYFIEEQVYAIPLFGYQNPYLLKDGITGVSSNPQGSLDLKTVKLPK